MCFIVYFDSWLSRDLMMIRVWRVVSSVELHLKYLTDIFCSHQKIYPTVMTVNSRLPTRQRFVKFTPFCRHLSTSFLGHILNPGVIFADVIIRRGFAVNSWRPMDIQWNTSVKSLNATSKSRPYFVEYEGFKDAIFWHYLYCSRFSWKNLK